MNEDANATAFQIMRYVKTHSAYYVWSTQTRQVFFLFFFSSFLGQKLRGAETQS